MFLKRIIIDGFKSYAKKVVIDKIDPHFNAITGLNGTGKSNILDSICFVMGLTSFKKARVQSLQGFIYKEGQAGVLRAAVTLVFDNSKKSDSPLGYIDFQEISVSRVIALGNKNKFLINGITAPQSRVLNFFQSVHLNIQNPHFLIMQGRISEVLSMSKEATLELLEEAAGTRAYEKKKNEATKAIEKKDAKLQEIEYMLKNEIEPKLKRLEKEKEEYELWRETKGAIEKLSYMESIERAIEVSERKEELEVKLNGIFQRKENCEREVCDLEAELQELNQAGQLSSTGEMKKLSEKMKAEAKEIKELENREAVKETEMEHIEQDLRAKTKTENKLRESILESEKELFKTQKEKIDAREKLDAKRIELDSMKLKMGMFEGEETKHDFEKETHKKILETKFRKEELATEIKEAKIELRKNEEFYRSKKETLEERQRIIDKYHRNEKDIEAKIKTFETASREIKKLESELWELEKNIKTKTRELEECASFLPYPISEKRKFPGLLGCVGELISVRKGEDSLAVETCAGNRLFNIITENEETAKRLIKDNVLKRRSTILPRDKLVANPLSINDIKSLPGYGNFRADELLEIGEENSKVAQFVFGRSIVCRTIDDAKKAAYSSVLKTRDLKAVTREGECITPSGIISGGYRDNRKNLLERFSSLRLIEEMLAIKTEDFDVKKKKLESLKREKEALRDSYQKALNEVKIFESVKEDGGPEREDLKGLISKQKERIDLLEKEAESCEKNKALLEENLKKTKENSKLSSSEREAFKKNREDLERNAKQQEEKLGHVENREIKLTKIIGERKSSLKTIEETIEKNREEISLLQNDIDRIKKEISEKKEINTKTAKEFNDVTQKDKQKTSRLAEIQKKKKTLSEEIEEFNGSVEKLEGLLRNASETLKEPKLSHILSTVGLKEGRSILKNLCETYNVHSELFKLEGKLKQKQTANIESLKKKKEDDLEELRPRVNQKVFVMQEKTTEEFSKLKMKQNKVLKDRKKINSILQELDNKKGEALNKAWKEVNQNFGNIFGTLLPGNTSELVPVKEKNKVEGLEIRVKLGEKWKESLSELSGGQKSLLALSLILSLLKYNPAPIYILDEIDAALDLSHTQNIGLMLRKYFTDSQFLIVSLKEGLFENANVVFRTKFSDGVSSVVRQKNNYDRSK